MYSYLLNFNFNGWWRSVVVSMLALLFNVVNRHWARLLLGWVTVCRQVNRLGMILAKRQDCSPTGKVTEGLAESNSSLPPGLLLS